jgi:WD40 repeat protein
VIEQPWPGSRPPVTAATYSADGRYILTADRYAQVCVWDSATYRQLQCPHAFGGFRISEQSIRGRDMLLSGPRPGKRGVENFFPLLRVRADTMAAEMVGGAIRGMLTMAAWTPEVGQDIIAWSSVNQRIYVKNLATGTVTESSRHPDIVNSVQFSTDGHWLVTASQDGRARVFSVRQLQQPIELSAGSTAMFGAAFHPRDPSVVVTAGQDGLARVWKIANGKASQLRVVGAHQEEVRSAAFGKSGTVVITASVDGTARIWSLCGDGKTPLLSLSGHRQSVTSAALSPDGKHALTASGDGTVRVWNVADVVESGQTTTSCR